MLKFLQLVILCNISFTLFGQFQDDFSDGDFTTNPEWIGETTKFIVNVSNELQLLAPAETSSAYLVTASESIDNAVWEFYIRMEFNPSSTNYARIYLVSNSPDVSGALNGYFVYVGGTADEISLFKQSGTTRTKILAGAPGTVNTSTVTAKIKVTRDDLGNWELFNDVTLSGTYISEGQVLDDTFIQSSYFGVFCDYTATRSDKFFFNHFVVTGMPFTDILAPELTSLTITSEQTLDLLFNEPMDLLSAEEISNYSIDNGIGNPFLAELDAANKALIHLSFTTPFLDGATHEITISGVKDVAQNESPEIKESFFYYIANIPSPGDILINEIMAKENPSVGQPLTEYVELFNTTSKTFDLSGWKICNDNTCGTIQPKLLLPNSYMIITPTSGRDSFPGREVINATSFPTLKNNADIVSISDNNLVLLDKVSYSLATYKDDIKALGGYSLERINPFAPCSGELNWRATDNSSGGTPGEINAVFNDHPDTSPLAIVSLVVTSPNSLRVSFSKTIDSLDLVDLQVELSPLISVQNVSILQRFTHIVDIHFVSDFELGIDYEIQFINVKDCAANLTTLFDEFVIPATPQIGEIRINEIMANPTPAVGQPETEYVELLNTSAKTLSLQGIKICNDNSCGTIQQKLILPGDYIVIVPTNSIDSFPQAAVINATSFPSLKNNGDQVILKSNDESIIIDKTTYSLTTYQDLDKNKGGYSLELINPYLPCSGELNWRASNSEIGGTPGLVNSIFDDTEDTSPPQIQKIIARSTNTIEITFNEFIDSIDVEQIIVSTEPSLQIMGVFAWSNPTNTIDVLVGNDIEPSKTYKIFVNNVIDCSGNNSNLKGEFVLPSTPNKGEIIINEILFNPYTGGSDYVELYNHSNKIFDLQNWMMANFTDTIANKRIISTNNLLFYPNSYFVLTKDSVQVKQSYPNHGWGRFVHCDLPSYPNSSGSVILLSPNDHLIDRVDYEEKWHFRLIDDKKGKSLERIQPQGNSNDASNWQTASETIGFGTPGIKNSQHLYADNSTNITIEPSIFSPDNDGYNDFAMISYNLPEPGMVGSILIYDEMGRKVRELVNNFYFDQIGSIKWDGIKDDGAKCAVGRYIVMIEINSSLGSSKKIAKRVVVVIASKI